MAAAESPATDSLTTAMLSQIWLDQVNDAIFVADASWHIQHWNRAAEQLYGWPRAEAVGRAISDVIPVLRYYGGDSNERVMEILVHEQVWRGTFVQRSRGGRELVIEGSTRAISNAAGVIQGYIGINRDVTDHQRAEEALRASEERQRAIIETGVEGVVLIGGDGQTRYVSSTIPIILGHAAETFADLRARGLSHPDDLPALEAFIAALTAQAGSRQQVTTRMRHADGSWRWIEQRGVNQLENPAVAAVIVSFHDVTEQISSMHALQVAVDRLRVLTSASLAFAMATTDYPALLDLVARMVGDHLGAGALIRLVAEEQQTLQVASIYDRDPEILAAAREISARAPIHMESQALEAAVARSGVPTLLPGIDLEPIRAALSDEVRRFFERIRPHSMLIVPLRAHGRSIGTLTLVRHVAGQPALTEDDLLLAQDLADRAALAISNARLYQDAQSELERRRATERSLLASEERFSAAFHASPVAFAIVEAQSGRYLAVNMSFQRLLGYTEVELIGQTTETLGVYVDLNQRALLAREVSARGMAHDHAVQIRTRAGEIREVLVSVITITFEDIQCLFSVLVDITDRVRVERAIAAEQARVIQLKNAFLATMSHELRTPLNTVLGSAELLLDGSYGPLGERQPAVVRRIEESGRQLLVLISDILDYARLEAGHAVIVSAPTPVVDLCRASVQQVAMEAQRKQIVPVVILDRDVTLIEADGRRLQQVLVNLLANAVKFTPDGGEVGLEVRGDRERAQVTFTVWDSGIGIAPADFPLLFQPFSQIDSRLSRAYEGAGLGLALVRQLVDAHGGSITVESEPGAGSRFTVTLPWGRGESPPALPTAPVELVAPPARSEGSPLILVVEDRESNSSLLVDLLVTRGYSAEVARDGAGGIERARARRPALILMDIHMPGMSGIEAIKRIRDDPRLHSIPIIAVTALVMPGDRERCMAAGADDYLAKPVSAAALIGAIAAHLARAERAER